MEKWIKFITVFCILGAFHLSLSGSVPVPSKTETDETMGNLRPNRGEEGLFFEGDIRLLPGEDPYNTRKTSYKSKREDTIMEDTLESGDGEQDPPTGHTWPDGVVPYAFPNLLSPDYRMVYEDAIRYWEDATCIDFVPRTNSHQNYLSLRQTDDTEGCSSYVGMKGGEQNITMSNGCLSVGHAIHELGHAIGLWHEHSRPDRNMYIKVNFTNIKEIQRRNFGILDQKQFSKVPDVGYDIESIMHYGEYAFTKDPSLKTIEILDDAPIEDCESRLPMGQRSRLSYLDKKRVNKLYQCTSHLSALQKPSCDKLDITPSITVPSTTAMPTPTTTQPPVTPSLASATRLKSGNVLTFQFDNNNQQEGMRCTPSPGCTPRPCGTIFGVETCRNVQHQFTIYNSNSKKQKIKSGNIVVLRSLFKPTSWLDCSDTRGCTITQCIDNSADTSNSSYISECGNHQFKILGVNRGEGKLLKSDHKIQLKHPDNDTYLNCSGKRCQLGEPQIFTLNKLRE